MSSAKRLSELLAGIIEIPMALECQVTGLTIDSRTVKPGDCFVAQIGEHIDARDYIQQAIAAGAHAIISSVGEDKQQWENVTIEHEGRVIPVITLDHLNEHLSRIAGNFYDHPSRTLQVIGITGTNGKTSVSHFIATALQALSIPCGVIGTLGYGFPGDLNPGAHTTPDPVTTQKALAYLRERGATVVAMEVSSHALVQGRVNNIDFDIAVFTNLSRDHLDYHGDMQQYGNAKQRLFEMPSVKAVVLNDDDAFSQHLRSVIHEDIPIFSYQLTSQAPEHNAIVHCVESIHYTAEGFSVNIATHWGMLHLRAGILGAFNVSNILATVAVLGILKYPPQQIEEAITGLKPVAGRMNRFYSPNKPLVVVDYAHTPDALSNALAAARMHAQGRLYCVFGCGGCRDQGKREQMAAAAQRGADYSIITDDNPRTEDPKAIVAQIQAGFMSINDYTVEHDRKKAIAQAMRLAKPEDGVLIAGKGHEDYQIIGEEYFSYSDLDYVASLFSQEATCNSVK